MLSPEQEAADRHTDEQNRKNVQLSRLEQAGDGTTLSVSGGGRAEYYCCSGLCDSMPGNRRGGQMSGWINELTGVCFAGFVCSSIFTFAF